jgi:hypothetical protein
VIRAVLFVGGEQAVGQVLKIPGLGLPAGSPAAGAQHGEELVTAGVRGPEEAALGRVERSANLEYQCPSTHEAEGYTALHVRWSTRREL